MESAADVDVHRASLSTHHGRLGFDELAVAALHRDPIDRAAAGGFVGEFVGTPDTDRCDSVSLTGAQEPSNMLIPLPQYDSE